MEDQGSNGNGKNKRSPPFQQLLFLKAVQVCSAQRIIHISLKPSGGRWTGRERAENVCGESRSLGSG